MQRICFGAWLAAASLLPTTAFAATPSEAVAFFYSPVQYLPDIELRDRFTDPVRTLFEQNDKAIENEQELACFDFSPAIDAQDVDEDELKRTLSLKEAITGDTAQVTASFALFPDGDPEGKREMLWTLKQINGAWLVSDLESLGAKWKLSDVKCEIEN